MTLKFSLSLFSKESSGKTIREIEGGEEKMPFLNGRIA